MATIQEMLSIHVGKQEVTQNADLMMEDLWRRNSATKTPTKNRKQGVERKAAGSVFYLRAVRKWSCFPSQPWCGSSCSSTSSKLNFFWCGVDNCCVIGQKSEVGVVNAEKLKCLYFCFSAAVWFALFPGVLLLGFSWNINCSGQNKRTFFFSRHIDIFFFWSTVINKLKTYTN